MCSCPRAVMSFIRRGHKEEVTVEDRIWMQLVEGLQEHFHNKGAKFPLQQLHSGKHWIEDKRTTIFHLPIPITTHNQKGDLQLYIQYTKSVHGQPCILKINRIIFRPTLQMGTGTGQQFDEATRNLYSYLAYHFGYDANHDLFEVDPTLPLEGSAEKLFNQITQIRTSFE